MLTSSASQPAISTTDVAWYQPSNRSNNADSSDKTVTT